MAGTGMIVQGYEALQRAHVQMIAAIQPAGALGRGVIYATQTLHQEAVNATHVWTGTLRASHFMDIQGARGRIYIQGRQNPITGGSSADYGPGEHAKGGPHAFYNIAFNAGHQAAGEGALQIIMQALP